MLFYSHLTILPITYVELSSVDRYDILEILESKYTANTKRNMLSLQHQEQLRFDQSDGKSLACYYLSVFLAFRSFECVVEEVEHLCL